MGGVCHRKGRAQIGKRCENMLMVNQRATHACCPSTEGEGAVQSCHHLP